MAAIADLRASKSAGDGRKVGLSNGCEEVLDRTGSGMLSAERDARNASSAVLSVCWRLAISEADMVEPDG